MFGQILHIVKVNKQPQRQHIAHFSDDIQRGLLASRPGDKLCGQPYKVAFCACRQYKASALQYISSYMQRLAAFFQQTLFS